MGKIIITFFITFFIKNSVSQDPSYDIRKPFSLCRWGKSFNETLWCVSPAVILPVGAGYDDSSASQEQGDDAVPPGAYYKYVWDINIMSGPTATDPNCLTYSYSSRVDIVRDYNSGLIGPLLICKAGRDMKLNISVLCLHSIHD